MAKKRNQENEKEAAMSEQENEQFDSEQNEVSNQVEDGNDQVEENDSEVTETVSNEVLRDHVFDEKKEYFARPQHKEFAKVIHPEKPASPLDRWLQTLKEANNEPN